MMVVMNLFNTAKISVVVSSLLLVFACGDNSSQSTTELVSPEPTSAINGVIKPSFNRSGNNNESPQNRAVLSKEANNATGAFSQPFDNETFAGNILASIDVQDADGIAAVALSFNQIDEVLYLCRNNTECNGTNFHQTVTAINPADFSLYTGPLTLGLWVVDVDQNQQQVDAVTVNWQRRIIVEVSAQRSIDNENITLNWQGQNALLKYNVYLASEANVNKNNYLQLNDGQAILASEQTSQSFNNLAPNKSYYFLITGIDGSGESAFSSEIRMDPHAGNENTPPLAVDDIIFSQENQNLTGNLLNNDSDIDDNVLTVTKIPIRSPFFGDLVIESDGDFTYQPQANFAGFDSFDYEIQDGQGGFAQARVEITINSVNDAPQALDDSYDTVADQSLIVAAPGILSNDSDIDGDILTVNTTPVTEVTNGSLMLVADGSFTYTPNTGFTGSDSFSYQVNDPFGLSDTALVIINVGGQNNSPIAVNDSYTTLQNGTLVVDGSPFAGVLANDSDPDGDSILLTDTLVNNVDNGSLSISNDGFFTYIPNANFNGTDSFVYEITDGQGGTAQATVIITVSAVNQAPIAVDDVASVDEDQTVTIDVLSNDSDPESNMLTITSWQTNNGAIMLVVNQLEYTPNANFNGSDTFNYTIEDEQGLTDSATVTITVNPINDAPVAIDDSASMAVGDSIVINVLSNDSDIDGDTLSVTSASADIGNATVNNDNTIMFSGVTSSGNAVITYNISDGNSGVASAMINVAISAVNQAPTAQDDSYTMDQNTTLIVDNSSIVGLLDNDSDPEDDFLTVNTTPVSDVSDGTLTLATDGTFTYTSDSGFFGSDFFEYEIADGNGNVASALVEITIEQVNTKPEARPDYYAFEPNINLTVTGSPLADPLANDFDADFDELSYFGVIDDVENGMLNDNNDSTFDYTPNNNFTGVDSYTYEVDDNNGGTSQALVTLTVSKLMWDNIHALPNVVMADYQGISFDGSQYFIVANGNILTSLDANTWNNHYQNSNYPLVAVASGNITESPSIKTSLAVGQSNNALIQQSDSSLGVWANRITNTNLAMSNVIASQGEFVATGQQAVMLSSDGINWSTNTPNTAVMFNSVVHTLGRMVVVGNNGTIEMSTSFGSSWSVQSSTTTQALQDIVSNNINMFVAVGNAGTVLTSSDGASWTARVSNTTNDLRAIAYGNGLYMAVGNNSTVITSVDSINWTLQAGIDSQPLNDVIFDGSQFVLVGDQANVFTSTDGISFVPASAGDNRNFTGIAYDNSDLIRAGTNTEIFKSADGINWSQVTSQSYVINQVEFFNDAFIAVGDGGLVLTSSNGNTWTMQTTPTTNNINDVFWFSGLDVQGSPFSLYVAVGDSGLLMTSIDAITWQVEVTGAGILNENFYAIDHDNDYFVAVGQNGKILVRNNTATPGATTWMDFFSNTAFGTLKDIIYNGTTNIIVGMNGVIVVGTAQGGSFFTLSTIFNDNLTNIAFSGNNYLIGSDTGVVFTSMDGSNWIRDISGTAQKLNDIIVVGDNVYAVGDLGTVIKGSFINGIFVPL